MLCSLAHYSGGRSWGVSAFPSDLLPVGWYLGTCFSEWNFLTSETSEVHHKHPLAVARAHINWHDEKLDLFHVSGFHFPELPLTRMKPKEMTSPACKINKYLNFCGMLSNGSLFKTLQACSFNALSSDYQLWLKEELTPDPKCKTLNISVINEQRNNPQSLLSL